jgi:inorganic pyrophosphatase
MSLVELPAYDRDGNLQVVVETPKGSEAKFKYDEETRAFRLSRRLPVGVGYPHDWGFVPGTKAADGDPFDALVYHELCTYPGVVIACRPLAVIRVTQASGSGLRQHNDRLIVVPAGSKPQRDLHTLEPGVRESLERFFVLAVLDTEKQVRIEGWAGAEEATGLVNAARDAYLAS